MPSEQLSALVHRIVTSQPASPFHTPGLAVVVHGPDGPGARVFAGVDGLGRPVAADTLFPLASATKLASGLVVLRLAERGALDLDAPIARYLPEARAARPEVTVRALLCHTAGLPLEIAPDAVVYQRGLTWREIASACLATPLAHAPGTRVQYSNVGYGLLAIAAERVTGESFSAAIESLVLAPLEVEGYFARRLPRESAHVIDIDSEHTGSDLEPANSRFFQELGLPWGGLWTTADGLLALVRAYDGSRPDLIGPALAAEATTDQTGGLGGGFGTTDPFLGFRRSRSVTWPRCPWGLVVELRGDKRPHWTPPSASAESFGQIGSFGCVAWCDPARRVSWAILGARTTDNGWLLRHGAALGGVALQQATAPARDR